VCWGKEMAGSFLAALLIIFLQILPLKIMFAWCFVIMAF
jgi:hypothetical protein